MNDTPTTQTRSTTYTHPGTGERVPVVAVLPVDSPNGRARATLVIRKLEQPGTAMLLLDRSGILGTRYEEWELESDAVHALMEAFRALRNDHARALYLEKQGAARDAGASP